MSDSKNNASGNTIAPESIEGKRERLQSALEYVDADDYKIWCDFGRALKRAGGESYYSLWDVWSMKSAKYDSMKNRRVWEKLKTEDPRSRRPVTIATIFHHASKSGWTAPGDKSSGEPQPQKHTLERILTNPEWDEADDLLQYIKAVYRPGDLIDIVNESFEDKNHKDKWNPSPGKSVYRKYEDIVQALESGASVTDAVGAKFNPQAGGWLRINPIDGILIDGNKAMADDNVTAFRFALIEADTMPLIPQYDAYIAYRLPIAAMVYSGGKSVHAIVRIDAKNEEEYRSRVEYLFEWLNRRGFDLDKNNGNPSRMSRIPGIRRKNRQQRLIAVNVGLPSWDEWYKYSCSVLHPERLNGDRPVFVCETAADADAIEAAGGLTIAPAAHALLEEYFECIKQQDHLPPLIATGAAGDPMHSTFESDFRKALTDEEGNAPAEILDVLFYDKYGDAETVAEFAKANPEQFALDVKRNSRRAEKSKRFSGRGVADYIARGELDEDIEYFEEYKDRKTGFSNIDRLFTPSPGLLFLGGSSSLGKTSFCTMLGYNFAAAGESVLYYSLEQEVVEIVGKLIAIECFRRYPDAEISNIDINNGMKDARIEDARQTVAKRAGNRFVPRRCDFSITIEAIEQDIEHFIRERRCVPIVVIDYLQIIAGPEDFRGDQRALTDLVIKKLKNLQRKYEMFMVVISNMARSQYDERASFAGLKETGLAEYSADFVLMMENAMLEQPGYYYSTKWITDKTGEKKKIIEKRTEMEKYDLIEKSLSKTERAICLVSLKTRRQRQRWKVWFTYYADHDCFVPEYCPVANEADLDPEKNPFFVKGGDILPQRSLLGNSKPKTEDVPSEWLDGWKTT